MMSLKIWVQFATAAVPVMASNIKYLYEYPIVALLFLERKRIMLPQIIIHYSEDNRQK